MNTKIISPSAIDAMTIVSEIKKDGATAKVTQTYNEQSQIIYIIERVD